MGWWDRAISWAPIIHMRQRHSLFLSKEEVSSSEVRGQLLDELP
eukprot:CAMPEP_0174895736 /NCGR_PEP_ID=MMETSP0167-20121228/10071_1 /TAXON_ID=38298 /ORGANISM="Rhodella maculata, Strain CCMP736" /LENGTH=43 /DNA_ID= /DNA_START= /DNA_END= /DNA_ORIENTATION=